MPDATFLFFYVFFSRKLTTVPPLAIFEPVSKVQHTVSPLSSKDSLQLQYSTASPVSQLMKDASNILVSQLGREVGG